MLARDVWVATFLIILLAVPTLRLVNTESQTLGQELITTTGLLATVLLVLTVALPARLRSVTRSFGIESVLSNHKLLGVSTVVMVLAHIALVLLTDPRGVALLVPGLNRWAPGDVTAPRALLEPLLTPPARAMAGSVSTLCLLALSILAARKMGKYERWRLVHTLLALVAVLAMAVHVVLINHLIPTRALAGVLTGDPLAGLVLYGYLVDPLTTAFLVLLAVGLVLIEIRRWSGVGGRYRVASIVQESPSVSTITVSPAGRRAKRFQPGQFAWVRRHRGPWHEEHPFTVSSAVQEYPDVAFTIRHTGDWTGDLRDLTTGDDLWLDGPHGSFVPDPEGGIVMIAGGVGITPALSTLRSFARSRAVRRRRPSLRLIVTDPPDRALFADELAALGDELDLSVTSISRAEITAPKLAAVLPSGHLMRQQDYYVCGSPELVADTTHTLRKLDVPDHRVHTERFEM